jgi:hypothetical protein
LGTARVTPIVRGLLDAPLLAGHDTETDGIRVRSNHDWKDRRATVSIERFTDAVFYLAPEPAVPFRDVGDLGSVSGHAALRRQVGVRPIARSRADRHLKPQPNEESGRQ